MSTAVKTKYMVLFGFCSLAVYFIVQQFVTHQYDFLTSFDEAIPFIPWTVWIYHTIVPVIVGTMFLLQKAKELPPLKRIYLLWAIGLSLSTLTLKMHYIIDVIGGFAIGTFSFFLIKSYIKSRSLYPDKTTT